MTMPILQFQCVVEVFHFRNGISQIEFNLYYFTKTRFSKPSKNSNSKPERQSMPRVQQYLLDGYMNRSICFCSKCAFLVAFSLLYLSCVKLCQVRKARPSKSHESKALMEPRRNRARKAAPFQSKQPSPRRRRFVFSAMMIKIQYDSYSTVAIKLKSYSGKVVLPSKWSSVRFICSNCIYTAVLSFTECTWHDQSEIKLTVAMTHQTSSP